MTVKCSEVIELMEEIAPKHLADDWDNVGLILGDFGKVIKHILVCLDITSPVVEYVEKANVDMIISHHPLIFKSIKKICMDNWKGNLISRLIKKDVCVYCAHTNLDYAEEGVNWQLALAVGLTEIENNGYTPGMVGVLSPPQKLTEFINNIKKALRINNVKLISSINKEINRVAVFSGSFDESILETIREDIDVLITGDIKYHTAIEISEMGMCVIDAGHFGTENIIVPQIAKWIWSEFPDIKISYNNIEIEPFKYY